MKKKTEKTEKGWVPHDGTPYLLMVTNPKKAENNGKMWVPHAGTPYLVIVMDYRNVKKHKKVGSHMMGSHIF